MLNFMTPDLFDSLIWAVIFIGGALAILRLLRDLTGPPRWPDDSSGPPGPSEPTPPDERTAPEEAGDVEAR